MKAGYLEEFESETCFDSCKMPCLCRFDALSKKLDREIRTKDSQLGVTKPLTGRVND